MPQEPMTPEEVAERLKESRKKNGGVAHKVSLDFTERRRAAEELREQRENTNERD